VCTDDGRRYKSLYTGPETLFPADLGELGVWRRPQGLFFRAFRGDPGQTPARLTLRGGRARLGPDRRAAAPPIFGFAQSWGKGEPTADEMSGEGGFLLFRAGDWADELSQTHPAPPVSLGATAWAHAGATARTRAVSDCNC